LGRRYPRRSIDAVALVRVAGVQRDPTGFYRGLQVQPKRAVLGVGFDIRIVTLNAEPWFVAADVCRTLALDLGKGTARHTMKLAANQKRVTSAGSLNLAVEGVVARIALKHFNALTHIENAIGLQNCLVCFGFGVFSAPVARSYHLGHIYVEYK